jgi:tetratricopeptide (TPR) repeat protein
MLQYIGSAVWKCPLGARSPDGENPVTGSVAALMRAAGRAARRRPWAAVALVTLLALLGTGAGVQLYAVYLRASARTALKEGRPAEAQQELAFCLKVWPRSVPTRILAARADRLAGNLPAAEAQLNKCLKLQKGASEDIQLEFLLMRVQLGDVDQVYEELMKYVDKKHPDTSVILATLTQAYMRNFRLRPALAILNRWIQEEPTSAQAYFYRGWVVETLNHHQDAMEDYLKAVELAPDRVDVRLRLAEKYLDQTRPADAAPHLEALKRLAPDRPEVLSALGRWKFVEGKLDEARPPLEKAVEKLPNDTTLLANLARLEMQESPPRPEEAEKWLRHLLEVDPADLEGQSVLVDSLRLQGRPDEAAEWQRRLDDTKALLKRANELLNDEVARPSTGPQVPYEIGSLYLRIGQDRVGLEWLFRALERDPGHLPTHEVLKDYYEKKGDREKAEFHRKRLGTTAARP